MVYKCNHCGITLCCIITNHYGYCNVQKMCKELFFNGKLANCKQLCCVFLATSPDNTYCNIKGLVCYCQCHCTLKTLPLCSVCRWDLRIALLKRGHFLLSVRLSDHICYSPATLLWTHQVYFDQEWPAGLSTHHGETWKTGTVWKRDCPAPVFSGTIHT